VIGRFGIRELNSVLKLVVIDMSKTL